MTLTTSAVKVIKPEEQARQIAPCVGCDDRQCPMCLVRPRIADALREARRDCTDCCCARSWKALGIDKMAGADIPEHITRLRARAEAAEAERDAREADFLGERRNVAVINEKCEALLRENADLKARLREAEKEWGATDVLMHVCKMRWEAADRVVFSARQVVEPKSSHDHLMILKDSIAKYDRILGGGDE